MDSEWEGRGATRMEISEDLHLRQASEGRGRQFLVCRPGWGKGTEAVFNFSRGSGAHGCGGSKNTKKRDEMLSGMDVGEGDC